MLDLFMEFYTAVHKDCCFILKELQVYMYTLDGNKFFHTQPKSFL